MGTVATSCPIVIQFRPDCPTSRAVRMSDPIAATMDRAGSRGFSSAPYIPSVWYRTGAKTNSSAGHAAPHPTTVIQSVGAGAAGSWAIDNLGPKMIARDFAPGFYVEHFIKDLGIALEEAARMELDLPGLELAQRLYDRLCTEGRDRDGTQALIDAIRSD